MDKKKPLISDKMISDIIRETLFESNESEYHELMKQKKYEIEKKKRDAVYKSSKKSGENELEEDGAPEENPKVKLEELPDISPEQIAAKINQIRAGKSLKDKGALNNLTNYFQRLNGPERIALYAFLQGLAKVIGGSDGDHVKVPASKPYNVDIERELPSKKSAPSGKSKSVPKKTSSSGHPERDSTPIVVGENANKSRELRIIKANRV